MAVVMMVLGFAHRHHAAMSDFALDVLKLDRRVGDPEAVMQNFLHVAENAFAGRGRNVGDCDMAGERVAL